MAFIIAAALLLATSVRVGPRTSAAVAGVALAMFVVLVRPSPSVLRATVMGAIGLFAVVTGRERRALRSTFAAVLLLVLFDPLLARSLGFALSTLATLGLLVLAPGIRARLATRLPGRLADAIAVPLAAQLACTPLIAAVSGSISLAAVPANMLAMPAVGLATVAGVLTAFVAPVSMPAARAVAWVAGIPTGWLVRVAETFAGLPASAVGWPSGWPGAASTLAVLITGALAARRRTARRAVGAAVAAALVALLGVRFAAPGWPPPDWALVVCDVGQGDALVVRAAGAVVVVDTGPDPDAVDDCLRDLAVTTVDAVVLTHMHADHVEGLPGVLRGRAVGVVHVGPLDEPADEVERVAGWLTDRRIPAQRIALGETLAVGGVRYSVLGPAAAFRGTESDPNNSSLVLSVRVPGLDLLLTGDVEEPAQLALLHRSTGDLRADVLKVPHHGSRKMLADFAAATGAAVAITSVGVDNPYGHPAPDTLTTLSGNGMRGYRTDRDGDVAVAPGRAAGAAVRVTARAGSGTPPARPNPAWARTPAYAGGARLWCPVRAPPGVAAA